jgi:hypothetical protein
MCERSFRGPKRQTDANQPQKDQQLHSKKEILTRVGFEPTQITLLAPEASALDRSAILPSE